MAWLVSTIREGILFFRLVVLLQGSAPRVVGSRYKCGASHGWDMTCAKVGRFCGSISNIRETRDLRLAEKWDGKGW